MVSVRKVVLMAPMLLIGSLLHSLAAIPVAQAQDKALSDAEIKKMEAGTKDFVNDLLAAGLWTKDCDELKQFNKYEPKTNLKIPKYNENTEDFEKTTFAITGAEYRRAFASTKAFANYSKLDEDAKKRVCREFFSQETRPKKGTAEFNAGIDKAKNLGHLILGEAFAAVDAPAEKP